MLINRTVFLVWEMRCGSNSFGVTLAMATCHHNGGAGMVAIMAAWWHGVTTMDSLIKAGVRSCLALN